MTNQSSGLVKISIKLLIINKLNAPIVQHNLFLHLSFLYSKYFSLWIFMAQSKRLHPFIVYCCAIILISFFTSYTDAYTKPYQNGIKDYFRHSFTKLNFDKGIWCILKEWFLKQKIDCLENKCQPLKPLFP